MGGGAQLLGLPMEPVDPDTCVRGDGKNLVRYWEENNPDGKVVTNAEQLFSVDIANTSRILGIFAPDHLPYHAVKTEETPSLANMTEQAIKLLRKNDNGFLLMVSSIHPLKKKKKVCVHVIIIWLWYLWSAGGERKDRHGPSS